MVSHIDTLDRLVADPLEVRPGRRYIVDTNLGRKLVEVVEVQFYSGDGFYFRLRRLRATAKKWTQVQRWSWSALLADKIRLVGGHDIDLIKAADAATRKQKDAADISGRLAARR